MEEIIKKIKEQNCVDLKIKNEFFYGKDYRYIRGWLKEHDLDPHMPLEIESAGIIIVVESNGSKKVLLQIRGTEKSRIGIFGGGIENGESPIDTAIRELREELCLDVKAEQLSLIGLKKHELTYAGGDIAHYLAQTFLLKYNEFPFIKLDYESNGIICLTRDELQDYINLKEENALQIYPYWLDFIYEALDM